MEKKCVCSMFVRAAVSKLFLLSKGAQYVNVMPQFAKSQRTLFIKESVRLSVKSVHKHACVYKSEVCEGEAVSFQ